MNWTDKYKWMYRVHLIGGGIVWAPHMERRTQHKYRLKSARGLFTIHKAPGLDFSVWGMWDIAKRGTTIPRATVTPLRTFYVLYNYTHKPYKVGGVNNEQ